MDRINEVKRERSYRREREEEARDVDRKRNEERKSGRREQEEGLREVVDKERNEEQTSRGVEDGSENGKEKGKGRRWADVYQFAFSEALTEIVEELQNLR